MASILFSVVFGPVRSDTSDALGEGSPMDVLLRRLRVAAGEALAESDELRTLVSTDRLDVRLELDSTDNLDTPPDGSALTSELRYVMDLGVDTDVAYNIGGSTGPFRDFFGRMVGELAEALASLPGGEAAFFDRIGFDGSADVRTTVTINAPWNSTAD